MLSNSIRIRRKLAIPMPDFFKDPFLVSILWFGLSLCAAIRVILMNEINNYKIFKYTYLNLIHFHSLYEPQPAFYYDSNHYGPIFAFIIAPFTYLPDNLACIVWVLFNSFVLYKAILSLPLESNQKILILLISAHELMTSSFSVQFNPIMTALILFSFTAVHRKKDFWAGFFIVLGILVKLYGVVGLVFFLFSKNKKHFILGLIFWFGTLFFLPALISSPGFLLHTYREWMDCLVYKNQLNIHSGMQDISVMGMIRRISGNYAISNAYILIPALVLYSLPLLFTKRHSKPEYPLDVLASTLMFTVLFSTGSESPTYIIAVTGMSIWYINRLKTRKSYIPFLLVFALIITSFSPSFLFPQWINEHIIRKYSLKALPIFLIWIQLLYDMVLETRKSREISTEKTYILSA